MSWRCGGRVGWGGGGGHQHTCDPDIRNLPFRGSHAHTQCAHVCVCMWGGKAWVVPHTHKHTTQANTNTHTQTHTQHNIPMQTQHTNKNTHAQALKQPQQHIRTPFHKHIHTLHNTDTHRHTQTQTPHDDIHCHNRISGQPCAQSFPNHRRQTVLLVMISRRTADRPSASLPILISCNGEA
jgi:hypothetical protein